MSSVKINRKVWDELRKKLSADAHVKVGVLAGAGGEDMHGDITMIELAAIHEFGSPAAGIPERSFVRSTFERKEVSDAMAQLCGKLANAIITDKMAPAQALGLLGQWGTAEIRRTIAERLTVGPDPQENAASTIARKGSTTPLVDTGRLVNAITSSVELGEK